MLQTYNKDYKERVKKFLKGQHFMHLIGFDLSVIEEGRTEGWLEIEQQHKQQKGFVHGGLVATLADITAGFAAYTLVPEDQHVVTAEIKVSYFRPAVGVKLHVVGSVLKQGRKINFCEAEVWDVSYDSKGQEVRHLAAKATTSMATVFPDDRAP
ncbi:PaaI family thioesterase [Nafulsella turpanensis]|uniref:PaaI family thioesterase n=1 Tax=Nafulsella turpanensis TaxID=1265690 RepID=UPI00034763A0|nr:PaaI family thioesterase [Nafulsella turpanensis]